MSLRIRRGTEAQRTYPTFDSGELIFTTDTKQLWIGDGVTPGGSPIVGSNITGYGLTFNASSKRIEVAGLTADDISNGVNNKFFSTDLAQDATAALFAAGTHTNISFQYDDTLNKINATVTLDGIGLTDIVNDTSPSLGGNLDLNVKDITGTGNIDIMGTIESTGIITGSNINTLGLSLNSDHINSSIAFASYDALANTSSNLLVVGTKIIPNTLYINAANDAGVIVKGISTSAVNSQSLRFATSKGSLTSPTILTTDSSIGIIAFDGFDGSTYLNSVVIGATATSVATGIVGGSLTIGVRNTAGNFERFTFTNDGKLTLPTISVGNGTASEPSIVFTTDGSVDSGFFHPGDGVICASTDGTERVRIDNGGVRVEGFMKVKDVNGTLPNPPEAGMIVLDGTTFKGYNGTAWVTLG